MSSKKKTSNKNKLTEEIEPFLKEIINTPELLSGQKRLDIKSAFTVWFLHEYATESLSKARAALTGMKEGGIDAIFIDESRKEIWIVQTKLRETTNKIESREDLEDFELVGKCFWDEEYLNERFSNKKKERAKVNVSIKPRLKAAIQKWKDDNRYTVKLYYVSTAKFSGKIKDIENAGELIANKDQNNKFIEFHALDKTSIKDALEDYKSGVAPIVPKITLKIIKSKSTGSSLLTNVDQKTNITSWIFSVSSEEIKKMHDATGDRLFARNIRSFLDQTKVNEGMLITLRGESTTKKAPEPKYFWYYNNGITIVCNDVEQQGDAIELFGPQVINGQQTTVTLAGNPDKAASVLVKVMKIPPEQESYESLIGNIVRATNSQNPISAADLISNDATQIFISRELRKLDYSYIRKKIGKSKLKNETGLSKKDSLIIKKEYLAKAVAATINDIDSSIIRTATKTLFLPHYYDLIFGNKTDIYYYLIRYWLMQDIDHVAYGSKKRSYARTITQRLTWQIFGERINEGSSLIKAFLKIHEREDDDDRKLLRKIYLVIKTVFKLVDSFRIKKNKSLKPKRDIQNFFKLRDLDSELADFITKNSNSKAYKELMSNEEEIIEALSKVNI